MIDNPMTSGIDWYPYSSRWEYIQGLQHEVDSIDEAIEDLKDQVEEDVESQIEDLQDKRNRLVAEIRSLS
jgi:peptidoglycan hydrolase CwlO-like protein